MSVDRFCFWVCELKKYIFGIHNTLLQRETWIYISDSLIFFFPWCYLSLSLSPILSRHGRFVEKVLLNIGLPVFGIWVKITTNFELHWSRLPDLSQSSLWIKLQTPWVLVLYIILLKYHSFLSYHIVQQKDNLSSSLHMIHQIVIYNFTCIFWFSLFLNFLHVFGFSTSVIW